MASYGGVNGLAKTIADAVKTDSGDMLTARQGKYTGGMVAFSDGTYPARLAVDININEGDYVWAVMSVGGDAVIVGA